MSATRWPAHPFEPASDDDKLREECGVYGVFGAKDAASFVALGLHALQHRGQEAAGIAAVDESGAFNTVRRIGYVRDNFTSPEVMAALPGAAALGHVRYSTSGGKGATAIRDVQPLYAELASGGVAIAHNGNFTNAEAVRAELIDRGSIFQSSSDTECVVHLMARSIQRSVVERMKDALRRIEGAFSMVALTPDAMVGVRDPLGIRPLTLGRVGDAWILSSETCALDIVGAETVRDVAPGEMITITSDGIESDWPFPRAESRFCIFEYVYFARPDSIIDGLSVYDARRAIGAELAREAPVEADLICPVPDSGTPAAIGYSQESGVPFAMGIVRNQYVGRTFIEPTEQIRNMGVRLKLNVNRALIEGKRVVLVDDSVVRGTTSRKIREMVKDAGAAEVHLRIASPPTVWPCFYGVDTPERNKLLAASMSEEEMRAHLGVDSIRFISLNGLYRACGVPGGRNGAAPRFCDACFSGEYPIPPSDRLAKGDLSAPKAT
jgi:amidophosphoribosyltransferase